MKINVDFRISDFNIAGDSQRLLVGEISGTDKKFYELFKDRSIWSLKRAKKRIIKKIIVLKPVEIDSIKKTYRETSVVAQ